MRSTQTGEDFVCTEQETKHIQTWNLEWYELNVKSEKMGVLLATAHFAKLRITSTFIKIVFKLGTSPPLLRNILPVCKLRLLFDSLLLSTYIPKHL